MGFLNWFKYKEKKIIINPSDKEWIDVSMVIYFDGSLTKMQLAEISVEIIEILMNTHSVFN